MKITVEEITEEQEEVVLRCHEINAEMENLLERINTAGKGLNGWKDDKIRRIRLEDIFYFEVVDNHSFFYCETEVYEAKMRLYEFEEMSQNTSFFRAGKSLIINSEKITYIEPSFSGRFEVTLENGEKRIVSRQYVNELKKRLGV